jgi:hypothetical protein
MAQAPTSRVPTDQDARLAQAKMNIRVLSLKHAIKTATADARSQNHNPGEPAKEINAAAVVAAASLYEEYLSSGILTEPTPATVGVDMGAKH